MEIAETASREDMERFEDEVRSYIMRIGVPVGTILEENGDYDPSGMRFNRKSYEFYENVPVSGRNGVNDPAALDKRKRDMHFRFMRLRENPEITSMIDFAIELSGDFYYELAEKVLGSLAGRHPDNPRVYLQLALLHNDLAYECEREAGSYRGSNKQEKNKKEAFQRKQISHLEKAISMGAKGMLLCESSTAELMSSSIREVYASLTNAVNTSGFCLRKLYEEKPDFPN
jgi:hypothetical protein